MAKHNKTIVAFYVPVGSGHKIATDAIEEAVSKKDKNIIFHKKDILDYSKIRLTELLYKVNIRTRFSGFLYDVSWRKEGAAAFTGNFGTFLIKNFSPVYSYLKETNPDIVITTHGLAAMIVSLLKRRGELSVHHIAVLTDFRAHPYWPKEGVDFYFASSFPAQAELIKRGIDPAKTIVSGIPLRHQFENDSVKKAISTNTTFEVLILSGALDASVYKEVAKETGKIIKMLTDAGVKVTIVCGKNKKLRKEITQSLIGQKHKHSVKVLGYIDSMEPLLARHDILVTKPGGLICAEAIAAKTPMILLSARAYGQEKGNVEFLVNNGIALEVKSLIQLEKVLFFITKHKNIINIMMENFGSLSRKQRTAATTIANYIINIFSRT